MAQGIPQSQPGERADRARRLGGAADQLVRRRLGRAGEEAARSRAGVGARQGGSLAPRARVDLCGSAAMKSAAEILGAHRIAARSRATAQFATTCATASGRT